MGRTMVGCVLLAAINVTCAESANAETQAVAGIVVSDSDSRPVEGAFVVLEPVGDAAAQCEATGAATGRGGGFEIPMPPCQDFEINVQKAGFLPYSQSIYPSGEGSPTNELDRSRDSNGIPSQLELRIVPQAVITGRVTDPAGQPLIGAVVQLSNLYVRGRRSALATVTQVTTNDLGEYRMFGLTPGRYYVGAFFQDQGSRLGLRKVSDQGGGVERTTEDYAVTYYPWSPELEGATVVRARGGQVADGIDIQVQLRRSFTVTGIVAGLPPGVNMPMVHLEPSQYGGIGTVRYDIPSAESTGFEFRSVSPGTYTVRTEVNLGHQLLSARQQVTVGVDPTENVVLDLKPPFDVVGEIVGDGDSFPKGARFRISGLDRHFYAPIEPDVAGRFEVSVPGPDRYLVDVISDEGKAYIKSLKLDAQSAGPDGADVNGPGHLLSVLVSNEGGRIGGIAVDGNDRPVTRGLAVLVSATIDDPSAYSTTLSVNGSFEFEALPPGRYRLSVFSDLSSPGESTWDVQRTARGSGEAITLEESGTENLRIRAGRMDPH